MYTGLQVRGHAVTVVSSVKFTSWRHTSTCGQVKGAGSLSTREILTPLYALTVCVTPWQTGNDRFFITLIFYNWRCDRLKRMNLPKIKRPVVRCMSHTWIVELETFFSGENCKNAISVNMQTNKHTNPIRDIAV